MEKNKLIKKLNIIEGQIRGVSDMIKNGKYCIDIITQTSAIKSALSSVEDNLMEKHLQSCLIEKIKTGKQKSATKEIMKVYKLKRK